MENNTIEELAPVIFWSISNGENGKFTISTLVPPLINEKKRLLSQQVDLMKQGIQGFNLIHYREMKLGQLRMLFIQDDVAKKGLIPLLNMISMDPNITQRLYLVIVQGNFDEYIASQLIKQENLDYFLYRMFHHYERNNQGEITVVNLHQYLKRLYTPYSDPILPVFKVNKENFAYKGTAVFKDDKLITTATHIDDHIFQLISNDYYLKLLPIPELSVSIGQLRSHVDMKFNEDYSSLSVKVDLSGRIEDYQADMQVLDQGQLLRLNQEVERYMETHTSDLLVKLQKLKVDPIQIGNLTLAPFRQPMSEETWLSYWEKMKFEVDYEMRLETLTIDNKDK
ncbi:Ger(x)C family spore germination protein [Paenibacillus agricola]|nr:Ger(x)C family spore germination C-terminal domain-containing protein [Paenibacillus agricola]